MRILQIILAISLLACQNTAAEDSKKNKSEVAQSTQSGNQIKNGIVFRDAQGKFLTEAEKDSIV